MQLPAAEPIKPKIQKPKQQSSRRKSINWNNNNPVAHSTTRRKSSNQNNKNQKPNSKSGRSSDPCITKTSKDKRERSAQERESERDRERVLVVDGDPRPTHARRPDLLHLLESFDHKLYLSGHDPPDSSSVVDHGSISESLSPALSVSLFHLPFCDSVWRKWRKKWEEWTTSVGKRERMKKI
jgi:hypothetical protein